MDLGLADKSAVVLASTSGLGLAVAQALLAEGARVAISGRDEARVKAVSTRLEDSHPGRVLGEPLGEPLDVRDRKALVGHLQAAHARWGVDILVTNAGGPRPGSALDVDDESLDEAFELTLKSAVHAIQTVLPWMRERGWGRIIAMTSSSVRQPIAGLALSNTLRAGLTGWLKTLSAEVAADGVLVNSVCTGMFDTDRLSELFEVRARKSGRKPEEERTMMERDIPVRRIGRVEEFGAVVAFLASEQASFMNGVALPVDGGASRYLL